MPGEFQKDPRLSRNFSIHCFQRQSCGAKHAGRIYERGAHDGNFAAEQTLHAPRDLGAKGLQQHIAGFGDLATQDDQFGIKDKGQACNSAAEYYGCFLNNVAGNRITLPRQFEYFGAGG